MVVFQLLQSTCIKPSYSLRNQLLVSFGSTALITITLVIGLSIFSAISAGKVLRDRTHDLLRNQVVSDVRESSRYFAENINEKIDNLQGVSAVVAELVKDRIVGYPDQGYELDLHVPFKDYDTGKNIYPIKSPQLPLDWNITLNINLEENGEEHLQERARTNSALASIATRLSTHSASIFFQGVCDPNEKNATSPSFYHNCTQANNNITNGGIIQPTSTSYWLAQKAADLGLLLKPLFESQTDILSLGIYMHNMGAGATVHFPGYIRDANYITYESIGCDWMVENINPFTRQPFATQEEVDRCHPKGEIVSNREYNPMERQFCRDQVLNHGRSQIFGPYQATSNGHWILSFGEAVFDRMTGHFIACITVDIDVSELEAHLEESLIAEYDDVALVRWDGTHVAATRHNVDIRHSHSVQNLNETGFIDESIFRELVDLIGYDKAHRNSYETNQKLWTEYLQLLRNTALFVDEIAVSAYPIPVPPREYDPTYKPEFLIVLRVGEQAFGSLIEIEEQISDDLLELIISTFAIGVIGVFLVIIVVWSVSRILTQPLNWMESIAWRIVNHTDKRVGQHAFNVNDDEAENALARKCKMFRVQTEITQLVSEFRMMINGFSGLGSSNVAKTSVSEMPNSIRWQNSFQEIYGVTPGQSEPLRAGSSHTKLDSLDSGELGRASIDETDMIYSSNKESNKRSMLDSNQKGASQQDLLSSQQDQIFLCRKNQGHLVQTSASRVSSSDRLKQHLKHELNGERISMCRVSLFLWIVILIVIPILLTNLGIFIVVRHNIVTVLPSWVILSEEASSGIAMGALNTAASLRASLAEKILVEPIRDLYLLTRVGGWLFFNGVNRSDGFTQMDTGVEECKIYPGDRSCPYYSDLSRTPCDCEWNDAFETSCQNYDFDSRTLLKRNYCAQAQDADPLTGNRFNISYPETDRYPNATLWWDNISEIPGSWKGSSASGYETAYDRLRVSSAFAVIEFPIYNYLNRRKHRKHIMGTYIGFEADGMFGGFGGCEYAMAQMAQFQSTESNKAAEVGGDLCPLGKYGYDPRCRDWYGAGKNRSLMGEAVHVTPPYTFAVEKIIATSATSTLIDPTTGRPIAQTLVDFIPMGMFNALNDTKTHFSLVISATADSTGHDAVLGPNHTVGSPPMASVDLIFGDDGNATSRAQFKERVIDEMQKGEIGHASFSRVINGVSPEALVMSFAPVNIRAVASVDATNFSRGVTYKSHLVYSLGLSRRVEDLQRPFKEIEQDIHQSLDRLTTVYLGLVIVISAISAMITCMISVAVTKPMIILLRVVQSINARRVSDDIPPMKGGSREVNQVYTSFAKLYKIVRFSNVAFYSGNVKWAYHFVSDALHLFRKIKDQKAIAIASNNLGNTLLAMSIEKSFVFPPPSISCNQVDGMCCVKAAIGHFNEAIKIGTRDFETTDDEIFKVDFAKQLADRHFNRALLYLGSRDCGCTSACFPADGKEIGYQDLNRAKELDNDVREFLLERDLILKNSDEYFERLIRRLYGLVYLDKDERCRDIYDFKTVLDNADQLLFAAWDEEPVPLFTEMSKIARLQQLESAAMILELSREREFEAARLGMRMLVEDEYLIDYAFKTSGNALLRFMKRDSPSPWTGECISSVRADLRKMTKYMKNSSLDFGKGFVLCLEVGDNSKYDDTVLTNIRKNTLRLFDEYFSKDNYVGLVGFSGESQQTLFGRKDLKGYKLRAVIELAVLEKSGTKIGTIMPLAVQMAADLKKSVDHDIFILYMTDGSRLDSESLAAIKLQIEELNTQREASVNVIVIGLDLEDHTADQLNSFCAFSRSSQCIKTTPKTLDSAFDKVTSLLTSYSAPEELLRGITMEAF